MDLSEEESTPLVIRDRGGSQRSSSSTVPNLQVNFFPVKKEAATLQITSGQISAENVCIQAGKKCGKTVMNYVLCKSLIFVSHIHYCGGFSSRNLAGIPKSIWFGIWRPLILVSSFSHVWHWWKLKSPFQSQVGVKMPYLMRKKNICIFKIQIQLFKCLLMRSLACGHG